MNRREDHPVPKQAAEALPGEAPPPPRRRVAVVAVHGVADQQPGHTAQRIASLLARFRPNGDFAYQAPAEVPIKVGVRPPLIGVSPADEELEAKSFIQPSVRAALQGELPSATEDAPEVAGAAEGRPGLEKDLGFQVIRDQIAAVDLPAEDTVWETLRIETQRQDERCEVHVHEMYWADLSRLGNKLFSTLLGLYQLLFFLPVLGSRTLAFAQACVPGAAKSRLWKVWGQANAVATRILVWGVPILNLLLLTLIFVVGLRAVDLYMPSLLPLLPRLVLVAVTAGTLTWWLYASRERRFWSWLPWFLRPLLVLAALGALWGCFHLVGEQRPILAAALALWLALTLGVLALLWLYDKRLPGAFLAGLVSTLAFLAWLLGALGDATTVDQVTDAALELGYRTVHVVHWGLWFGFALALIVTMVCGFIVTLRTHGEDRRRIRRATWTIDLSLALAAPVILAVDLAVWAALLSLSENLLVAKEGRSVLTQGIVDRWWEVLVAATPPFWIVWIAIFVVALLATLWAIWPAVGADARRRRQREDSPTWLGRNLTQGFLAARIAGESIRLFVVVGLPFSALWLWFRPDLPEIYLETPSRWSILALGTVLSAAVLGRGPLSFLALGFRSALDIAFDVVNWLRWDPPRRTPSGRILSRYFSLFRHIRRWRHAQDGGRYTAIVVLAHSQGAVITADALRQWQAELARHGDDEPPIPIHLLTMGAPLHQLYGLRFPFRYKWAWSGDGLGGEDGDERPRWPSSANDPDTLGVRSWTNLYHSGDYVGRFLWHPARDGREDTPYVDRELSQGRRQEVCLGAGGHNTYWDGHSPGVTEVLDQLIELACCEELPP